MISDVVFERVDDFPIREKKETPKLTYKVYGRVQPGFNPQQIRRLKEKMLADPNSVDNGERAALTAFEANKAMVRVKDEANKLEAKLKAQYEKSLVQQVDPLRQLHKSLRIVRDYTLPNYPYGDRSRLLGAAADSQVFISRIAKKPMASKFQPLLASIAA